jgi:hypothetical protein
MRADIRYCTIAAPFSATILHAIFVAPRRLRRPYNRGLFLLKRQPVVLLLVEGRTVSSLDPYCSCNSFCSVRRRRSRGVFVLFASRTWVIRLYSAPIRDHHQRGSFYSVSFDRYNQQRNVKARTSRRMISFQAREIATPLHQRRLPNQKSNRVQFDGLINIIEDVSGGGGASSNNNNTNNTSNSNDGLLMDEENQIRPQQQQAQHSRQRPKRRDYRRHSSSSPPPNETRHSHRQEEPSIFNSNTSTTTNHRTFPPTSSPSNRELKRLLQKMRIKKKPLTREQQVRRNQRRQQQPRRSQSQTQLPRRRHSQSSADNDNNNNNNNSGGGDNDSQSSGNTGSGSFYSGRTIHLPNRSILFTGLVVMMGLAASTLVLGFGISNAVEKESILFNIHASELVMQLESAWSAYETTSRWVHQACHTKNFTRREFRNLYQYILQENGLELQVRMHATVPCGERKFRTKEKMSRRRGGTKE